MLLDIMSLNGMLRNNFESAIGTQVNKIKLFNELTVNGDACARWIHILG